MSQTDVNIPDGFVVITVDHFNSLKEDEQWRIAVEDAGIDNWPGYDYAMEMLKGRMLDMSERYYINRWVEVSKEEYVAFERENGFRNTLGQPDEPATSMFSAGVDLREVRGRIRYGDAR